MCGDITTQDARLFGQRYMEYLTTEFATNPPTAVDVTTPTPEKKSSQTPTSLKKSNNTEDRPGGTPQPSQREGDEEISLAQHTPLPGGKVRSKQTLVYHT